MARLTTEPFPSRSRGRLAILADRERSAPMARAISPPAPADGGVTILGRRALLASPPDLGSLTGARRSGRPRRACAGPGRADPHAKITYCGKDQRLSLFATFGPAPSPRNLGPLSGAVCDAYSWVDICTTQPHGAATRLKACRGVTLIAMPRMSAPRAATSPPGPCNYITP